MPGATQPKVTNEMRDDAMLEAACDAQRLLRGREPRLLNKLPALRFSMRHTRRRTLTRLIYQALR